MPAKSTSALTRRNAKIAREAMARGAVVDAALALDDDQWVWIEHLVRAYNGKYHGEVATLARKLAALRAIQGEPA